MTWDDVKVVLASATGLGSQFTTIDAVVKILVGVATIAYIVTKTVKLWQGKGDK